MAVFGQDLAKLDQADVVVGEQDQGVVEGLRAVVSASKQSLFRKPVISTVKRLEKNGPSGAYTKIAQGNALGTISPLIPAL